MHGNTDLSSDPRAKSARRVNLDVLFLKLNYRTNQKHIIDSCDRYSNIVTPITLIVSSRVNSFHFSWKFFHSIVMWAKDSLHFWSMSWFFVLVQQWLEYRFSSVLVSTIPNQCFNQIVEGVRVRVGRWTRVAGLRGYTYSCSGRFNTCCRLREDQFP